MSNSTFDNTIILIPFKMLDFNIHTIQPVWVDLEL